MTTFDDEDLRRNQHEVQRLLGRCMLRLQQYERQIKAMVAHGGISGPILDLEQAWAEKIEVTRLKTLGTLVGELLGTYVVSDKNEPNDDTINSPPENVNWVAMKTGITLPDEDFARVERELKEMVTLRNNLVHHFIDHNDIWNVEGCRRAQDVLVAAYSRIDQNLAQLRKWAESMSNARQAMQQDMRYVVQSAEFMGLVVNGIAFDGTVDWNAAGIVSALREAFGALATDGWAPVVEAGKWIAERYPEQQPAKYGCKSWRQVVHKSPILELRYFEMRGQRTAQYREMEVPAKSL